MPRRSVLTDIEKQSLAHLPDTLSEMSKHYLLSETDLSIINQKRGNHNKLGFALLICCMRHPGILLTDTTVIPEETIEFIADQLKIKNYSVWRNYFKRDQTRREHLVEAQSLFGFKIFNSSHYRVILQELLVLAKHTDKGIVIASELVHLLQKSMILLPSIAVLERLCAEVITLGNQKFYRDLTAELTDNDYPKLDALLKIRVPTKISYLAWLQQTSRIPKPKHILLHIERLRYINSLELQEQLGKNVHHNRLVKLAKEGRNMFARDIQELEPTRRYATIVAILLETKSTIIDEIVELNDKILGDIFNKAKHSHNYEFQNSSKSINEKLNLYLKIGQALIIAKQENVNPYQAIESVISWSEFTQTVNETKDLAKPDNFDFLYKITTYYPWIKRFIVEFLDTLEFKAFSNSAELFRALLVVKEIHEKKLRKVPDSALSGFIKKRWHNLVFKEEDNVDRQFYEFAVLSELKNALRSGDIWVKGSRQYKDFNDYLLDNKTLDKLKKESPLLAIANCSFDEFIKSRTSFLTKSLEDVSRLVIDDELSDATLTSDGLKITPLTNSVPDAAYAFNQKVYRILPKIKITSLLQEVDGWVNYTQQFTHLKNDKPAENKQLLLTVILSDAINLGLTKMAGGEHLTLSYHQYRPGTFAKITINKHKHYLQMHNTNKKSQNIGVKVIVHHLMANVLKLVVEMRKQQVLILNMVVIQVPHTTPIHLTFMHHFIFI